MKRLSMVFLQIVVVLAGIAALVLMLWEPHLEGRNAHATLSEIYFKDPFLAYAYLASIAFFVALYQAFKLLRNIGQGNWRSVDSMKILRKIKYCALILIAFLLGGELYIGVVQRGSDDIAGGVMMGVFLILVFVAVAGFAARFEARLVRQVVVSVDGKIA